MQTRAIFIKPQPEQNNILLFYQYPALRNPRYWTLDQRGKKYIFDQILADTLNDPVSLILRGQITPEQEILLSELEALRAEVEDEGGYWFKEEYYLADPRLCAFIAAKQITLEKLMTLPKDIVKNFEEFGSLMTAAVTSKIVTWEQAATSTMRDKLLLLDWWPIKTAIQRGEISTFQVVILNEEIVASLKDQYVREGMAAGKWTLKDAMTFGSRERNNIFTYGVPEDIGNTQEWQDELQRLRGIRGGPYG